MESFKIGRYRHYKGQHYWVMGIAFHSESEEKMVLYKQLYGNETMWVRPYKMFLGNVDVGGQIIKRFEKIQDI